ncbi:hypothetical protein [Nevskia sp.]|uniref:hypothetical protein n=1 Tax=Nevskia sp. TaxID=1929292 RepID=UPI003F701582
MTAQAITDGLLAYLQHGPRPLLMVQMHLQRQHGLSHVEANRTLLIALKYGRIETHGMHSLFVRAAGDPRRWPRQPQPRPPHRGPCLHPAFRSSEPAAASTGVSA